MLRLAANLSFLFQELPFLDRFAAAARCGFRGVEFMFPYDEPVAAVADAVKAAGVRVVLFNLPPGDWDEGDRGLAAVPDRAAAFRRSIDLANPYIAALRPMAVHIMAGTLSEGADAMTRALALDTYCANLRYAVASVATNCPLTIEPINRRDMPGYYLHTVEQAAAVLDAVDHPRLRLQFDCYHAQNTGGDIARRLEAHIHRIAHIQIAGNPGRHEPSVGEIHYPYLFARLEALGYAGWVGCEYRPRTTTRDGLGWAVPYGIRAAEA